MLKRKHDDPHEDAARQKIDKRYEERLGLYVHTAAYIGMNLVFWLMFLSSGAGFPWPLFVTAGWGIGYAAHTMNFYYTYGKGAEKKEAEIEAEIERQYRLAQMQDDRLYDFEPDADARVYDLDNVKASRLRLNDDGELVDFAGLDENEDEVRRRA